MGLGSTITCVLDRRYYNKFAPRAKYKYIDPELERLPLQAASAAGAMPVFDPENAINTLTEAALRRCETGYVRDGTRPLEQMAANGRGEPAEVRLDLGRNPDGCAPQVAEKLVAWLTAVDAADYLSRYPSPAEHPLRRRIARLHGVRPERVVLSAGVEQMVGQVAAAFLSPGDRVLVCRPSFFVFRSFSTRVGARVVDLALDEEAGYRWTADTGARYAEALERTRPRIVWIADPNNPTGGSLPDGAAAEIAALAERCGALAVFDEAYGEYRDPEAGVRSASALLDAHHNAIVTRTFSKAYGLASLRVGWAAAGSSRLLEALRVQAPNYPVSQLSLDAAAAAMDCTEHLRRTRANTRRRRAALLAGLDGLREVEALPSDSNLLVLAHRRLDAGQLHRALLERGVRTARIPGEGRFTAGHLRVAIGRSADNQRLVEALADIETARPVHISHAPR